MSFEQQSTNFLESSYGEIVDLDEGFDAPKSREYDWKKRSNEIKERDDYICQRCGRHNGNYEHHPLSMETHHIVPGKYLPKADARVGLNLVTVCGTCHSWLEGAHVGYQLAETGRDEALRVLTSLEGRGHSVRSISRELELSEKRVQSVLSQLERMNCVTSVGNARYRRVCPATAKSAAERATWQLTRERTDRQELEATLADLRQEVFSEIDKLESALTAGDGDRLESTLERLRDTLTD